MSQAISPPSQPSHLIDSRASHADAAAGITDRPGRERRGPTASLASELQVVGQMLATMDTLTTSGQRHLMHKIVGFFEGLLARRAWPDLGPGNRRALTELVKSLARECERPSPDAAAFAAHGTDLIELLTR